MATVSYTVLKDDVNEKVIKWSPLTTTNSDGQPYVFAGRYPDKNVQVYGTLGAGGKITVQGTNETAAPGNWLPLNDAQGVALDITAAKIKQVLENTHQFRPIVAAGDGTTSLTVIAVFRK